MRAVLQREVTCLRTRAAPWATPGPGTSSAPRISRTQPLRTTEPLRSDAAHGICGGSCRPGLLRNPLRCTSEMDLPLQSSGHPLSLPSPSRQGCRRRHKPAADPPQPRSIPAGRGPAAAPPHICSGLVKPSHSGSFIHFLRGFPFFFFLQLQGIISL